MAFTPALAQHYIKQINKYFESTKKSKKFISQLVNSLIAVKASKPKDKEQAAKVLQCLLEHLKTTPLSGQFDSVLRLLSIHTASDSERLKVMLHRALELVDVEALNLLVNVYGLDIDAAQDAEGNTLLHLAVKAGDLNQVRWLINLVGAEVNAQNKQGATALHLAAAKDQLEILDFLLSNTETMNVLDNRGRTPFHHAAENNCVNALDALQKSGTDVNAADIDGNTALHLAVKKANVSAYKFLLQTCKTLINRVNNVNASALEIAAVAPDEVAVQFLLENGADLNLRCPLGNTILHRAAGHSSQKICALLINHLPKDQQSGFVNATNSEGWTPFFCAISTGSLEVVRYFLEPQFKVDINYCTEKRVTALFLAIRGRFSDKARLLLENGADISLHSENEHTALHIAAGYGLVDICNLLLNHKSLSSSAEKNAYIYARTNINRKLIPLHSAAIYGHVEVVEYFIKCGVDINTCNVTNRTALHMAIRYRQIDVVKVLLANGADLNASDDDGVTPLHEAAMFKDSEILELLVNHKPKLEFKKADINARDKNLRTPLFHAVGLGNTNVVEYLIKCGADVNSREKNKTVLHWAVIKRHDEIIALLLAHGADVTAQDVNGDTPLHCAAEKGDLNTCKMLVNHRPKTVEAKEYMKVGDKSGLMPIHYAAIHGKTEIIDYFLQNGVESFWKVGKKGETILHLAAKFGREDTVVSLLEKKLDPKELSSDGTALHSAVVGGQLKTCRLLIDRKPQRLDPLTLNRSMLAAINLLPLTQDPKARLEIAKYFIEECKIDVDLPGVGMVRPLHQAAHYGITDLINYYISRGANISAVTNEGRTALYIAVRAEKIEAAELLLQAGIKPDFRYGTVTALSVATSLQNPAMLKLLHNFIVNHNITAAIWNIAHKIAFSTLQDRNLAIIPDLQNIIVRYAKLDPSDLETLKSMGLDQKTVIEMAEEVLLSFATLLGKEEETFLNNLAGEVFGVVPDPSKCKIYWEKLKEQFEKDPKILDLVQRPSKLDKNQFPSKSETKDREEKHGPTFRRSNELEQPSISSELQSAPQSSPSDVRREKIEEKTQSFSNPKSNAFDLDADAIMLPPSTSSVTSSSISSSTQALVATAKSCLDEWFWQLPAMNGSEPKASKKKGEKRKLEEKQETDLESHKQSKNENSLDGSTSQTAASFFSPSSPHKRKSEEEHESENGKKAKCESSSNESGPD